MSEMYFDYIGSKNEGFGFGVSNDSPNQIMAAKMSRLFARDKPFRMYVSRIEELGEKPND